MNLQYLNAGQWVCTGFRPFSTRESHPFKLKLHDLTSADASLLVFNYYMINFQSKLYAKMPKGCDPADITPASHLDLA